MFENVTHLLSAFPVLLDMPNLLALCIGVIGGVVIGALPGLTPTMGVAVLVPFTFGMSAETGLILLGGVYCSSVFAGAITAILVNIPGAPANVATLFDGYPMARSGKARQAIYYATSASMVGGLFGMVVFLLFSPPLAKLSLLFGPAEVFWVAIFGLTIIASLSMGNILKGLISGVLGLCLSLVGMDSVTGNTRFTHDLNFLLAGIPIVAGLIGIFALSQLFSSFEEGFRQPDKASTISAPTTAGELRRVFLDTLRRWKALTIGSVVGTIVGIIPGAGGQIAALTAYNEAKRWATDAERETFGQGNPDGIVAAESANNAMCGGSLVPLFTLGIPGSPTAAVLLGGLLIHGLYPGHRLYTEHGDVVYVFILSMFLAQIVMFVVGVSLVSQMTHILKIPQRYLGPSILALCVIGAFATQNSMGDVYIMTALGILMYLGLKLGFSPAAVVLGHILGGIAENGLLLGARIAAAKGSLLEYFFTQPICVVLIVMSVGSIALALWIDHRQRSRKKTGVVTARPPLFSLPNTLGAVNMRQWDFLVGIIMFGLGVYIVNAADGLNAEAALFPRCLGVTLCLLSALLGAGAVLGANGSSNETVCPWSDFPLLKMVMAVVVFVAYVACITTLGFYTATVIFLLVLPPLLQGRLPAPIEMGRIVTYALAFTGVLYLMFAHVLLVPTPKGLLS